MSANDLNSGNTLFLISADNPGCGSSTLANNIEKNYRSRGELAEAVSVGQLLRAALGVENEEDFKKALTSIADPHLYDPIIYKETIPRSGRVIVDGKLATTAGPMYADPERPIVCIELTAPLIFSAKRVMQREGYSLEEIFSHEQGTTFIEYYQSLRVRSEHDRKLKEELKCHSQTDHEAANIIARFAIDTSTRHPVEVATHVLGEDDFDHSAPDWELDAVNTTRKTLYALGIDIQDVAAKDREHFRHQLESIAYGTERLAVTTNPCGLESVRKDLKKAIIDCWFGLMLKKTLRFFEVPETGDIAIDKETHNWSPDFYKIAEGWPTLSRMLRDQVILDPFAGAGTLTNLLVARGIPKLAIFSDHAYKGGEGRVGSKNFWYEPQLNRDAARLLFDELPSWYKPNFRRTNGFESADARKLPFEDDAVDYVYTDPPYGKNLHSAGIGLLFGCLPELMRVAKKGSILLVPTTWMEELEAANITFEQLTKDVSNGTSNFPVCYILIPKQKQNTLDSNDSFQEKLF